MTRIYLFFWSWLGFIKYKLACKLKPVCKLSLKGIAVSYVASLVTTIAAGGVADLFIEKQDFDMDRLSKVLDMNPLLMMIAGIEDFIFVLPLFILPHRLLLAGMTISSVLFTLGHSYQGDAMYAKAATIPLVYLLARRYGIFSTALAHGINDVIALTLMQYLLLHAPL